MLDKNCLFCKIIEGQIPAEKVYEDDNAVAFKDISPQAPTHILVIPKAHYAAVHEVPDNEMSLMEGLFGAVKKTIEKLGLDGESYRLVVNSGEKSGQAVFHIHVHILSGRRMSWPPG